MEDCPTNIKVKQLYRDVLKKHPEFKHYFPDYDESYVPE